MPRLNKIARECKVSPETITKVLVDFGYYKKDEYLNPNTCISDELAQVIYGYYEIGFEFNRIEARLISELKAKALPNLGVKVVGNINLGNVSATDTVSDCNNESKTESYKQKKMFAIKKLYYQEGELPYKIIDFGSFVEADNPQLFTLLIGCNGVGKSSLLRDIVDFFVDVNICAHSGNKRVRPNQKNRLKGIHYRIDENDYFVANLSNGYAFTINDATRPIAEVVLPLIVACHFGAFDKFPTQRIGQQSESTRYSEAVYKYVGAHVSGSMISSSSIAFRLVFDLCQELSAQQRENICSLLDFIKYDHKVSLEYSIRHRKKADVRDTLNREIVSRYANMSPAKRKSMADRLFRYLTSNQKAQFVIDFDNIDASNSVNKSEDVVVLYKLKQLGFINEVRVALFKNDVPITSDEMSSGELAMLATVLSVAVAANKTHTLVLIDEPELSQHPNWQMEIIDNLDKALKGTNCHLIIATHSHLLVSDLPMKRSSVVHLERTKDGNICNELVENTTYGWSAEEVLLKVFKTATDRNRYFGERIGKLLEQMGNGTISRIAVAEELVYLQEVSSHLSDVDPMKMILNTIVETYR